MTDITALLAQVRAHNWWYSDQNLATQLIYAIQELTTANTKILDELYEERRQTDNLQSEIYSLESEIDELQSQVKRLQAELDEYNAAAEEASAHYFNRYIAGDR